MYSRISTQNGYHNLKTNNPEGKVCKVVQFIPLWRTYMQFFRSKLDTVDVCIINCIISNQFIIILISIIGNFCNAQILTISSIILQLSMGSF